VLTLALFRDRPDIRRLGQGSGISQATAYRYLNEAIELLADRASSLREALEKAKEADLPYLILDSTVVAGDRCAEKTSGKDHQQEGPGDRPSSAILHEFQPDCDPTGSPKSFEIWVS
jgi:hypothetical protein